MTTARPAMSAAVRATSGAAILQGPHHAAQKSTNTGTRAFRVISSNSSESTSRGSFTGGNGDLHAPQRPVSARCFAGIRFFCPQLWQVRTKGISLLLLCQFSFTHVVVEAPQPAFWILYSPR